MFGHVQDSFKTIKTTIKLVDFYQAALVLKNIVFFYFQNIMNTLKDLWISEGKKYTYNIHKEQQILLPKTRERSA